MKSLFFYIDILREKWTLSPVLKWFKGADRGKTKEQLIREAAVLRQRIAELEASKAEPGPGEDLLRKKAYALSERIKELNCLYGVSSLVAREGISLEETLQKVADLIPPAYQYPEITCARIILNDQEFTTGNFRETHWKQSSDIMAGSDRIGSLDVFYLDEKPPSDEGPFLKEERNLLNAVAERTGHIITHHWAETTLRESEEKFRLVTETVQDVFWMSTPGATRTIYVSPAYEKIWGHSVESVYENPLAFIEGIHPEDREHVLKGIKENPAGRWDFEYRVVQPDGSIRWVRDRGFPTKDEQGALSRMIGVATDITERKRAERELNAYRCQLEQMVQERTEKLIAANRQLKDEIAERRLAEESLKRSIRQNELILEAVGEGIYGVDLKGNITFINPSAVHMTGYTPGELIGCQQHNIFHHSKPDGSPYFWEECPVYAAIKDGVSRHVSDDVFWKKDGRMFPVEYVSAPIQEEGTITGAVVVFKDITDRRRMEEELRKSQAQMTEAQRLAHVGSWDWDILTGEVTISEEFERIVGFKSEGLNLSLEEYVGMFNSPDIKDNLMSVFKQTCQDKQPFEYQHQIFRLDGSTRIVRGRGGVSSTDAAGNPLKLTGFIQDITEIKKAEDAVRESEKKYRQLVENAQEGIWAIDTVPITSFVNNRMAEMLGYTVQEMMGRPVSSFMDEDGAARFRHDFELRRQGIKQRHKVELIHKNGSRVYTSLDSSPILDEEGNFVGAIVLVTDITGEKRIEEEKEKIQAQLLQSQKLEAIGILAGGVAHDFNNLLTTIQGYTSMALKKVDKADRLSRDLNQVQLAAGRAADLTRQLLLFSRKQPTKPSCFNLNVTVDNLLKMLHRLIGEDITIGIALEPALWPIRADEGNIEQVIMNLVINARDAMPRGGEVGIKTENRILDEKSARGIAEARPGRFICLSITDTGMGMDKETISRIFEPFFTTKGVGKGTGLGLSVVYGIIKQHEGWITIDSESGHGSVFRIYLPAATSLTPEDTVREATAVQGEVQGRGERILLVEDEEGVREMTARALRENGYCVAEAANVQDALDTFEQEKGDFHLVLSDVVLPDQTGLELIDRILLCRPDIRIMLASGYPDQKSEWASIREKGFRFVQKPYALTDLLRSVRELIESRH
ncbi:MAG: PAS domain S-box protein [bacterium]